MFLIFEIEFLVGHGERAEYCQLQSKFLHSSEKALFFMVSNWIWCGFTLTVRESLKPTDVFHVLIYDS